MILFPIFKPRNPADVSSPSPEPAVSASCEIQLHDLPCFHLSDLVRTRLIDSALLTPDGTPNFNNISFRFPEFISILGAKERFASFIHTFIDSPFRSLSLDILIGVIRKTIHPSGERGVQGIYLSGRCVYSEFIQIQIPANHEAILYFNEQEGKELLEGHPYAVLTVVINDEDILKNTTGFVTKLMQALQIEEGVQCEGILHEFSLRDVKGNPLLIRLVFSKASAHPQVPPLSLTLGKGSSHFSASSNELWRGYFDFITGNVNLPELLADPSYGMLKLLYANVKQHRCFSEEGSEQILAQFYRTFSDGKNLKGSELAKRIMQFSRQLGGLSNLELTALAYQCGYSIPMGIDEERAMWNGLVLDHPSKDRSSFESLPFLIGRKRVDPRFIRAIITLASFVRCHISEPSALGLHFSSLLTCGGPHIVVNFSSAGSRNASISFNPDFNSALEFLTECCRLEKPEIISVWCEKMMPLYESLVSRSPLQFDSLNPVARTLGIFLEDYENHMNAALPCLKNPNALIKHLGFYLTTLFRGVSGQSNEIFEIHSQLGRIMTGTQSPELKQAFQQTHQANSNYKADLNMIGPFSSAEKKHSSEETENLEIKARIIDLIRSAKPEERYKAMELWRLELQKHLKPSTAICSVGIHLFQSILVAGKLAQAAEHTIIAVGILREMQRFGFLNFYDGIEAIAYALEINNCNRNGSWFYVAHSAIHQFAIDFLLKSKRVQRADEPYKIRVATGVILEVFKEIEKTQNMKLGYRLIEHCLSQRFLSPEVAGLKEVVISVYSSCFPKNVKQCASILLGALDQEFFSRTDISDKFVLDLAFKLLESKSTRRMKLAISCIKLLYSNEMHFIEVLTDPEWSEEPEISLKFFKALQLLLTAQERDNTDLVATITESHLSLLNRCLSAGSPEAALSLFSILTTFIPLKDHSRDIVEPLIHSCCQLAMSRQAIKLIENTLERLQTLISLDTVSNDQKNTHLMLANAYFSIDNAHQGIKQITIADRFKGEVLDNEISKDLVRRALAYLLEKKDSIKLKAYLKKFSVISQDCKLLPIINSSISLLISRGEDLRLMIDIILLYPQSSPLHILPLLKTARSGNDKTLVAKIHELWASRTYAINEQEPQIRADAWYEMVALLAEAADPELLKHVLDPSPLLSLFRDSKNHTVGTVSKLLYKGGIDILKNDPRITTSAHINSLFLLHDIISGESRESPDQIPSKITLLELCLKTKNSEYLSSASDMLKELLKTHPQDHSTHTVAIQLLEVLQSVPPEDLPQFLDLIAYIAQRILKSLHDQEKLFKTALYLTRFGAPDLQGYAVDCLVKGFRRFAIPKAVSDKPKFRAHQRKILVESIQALIPSSHHPQIAQGLAKCLSTSDLWSDLHDNKKQVELLYAIMRHRLYYKYDESELCETLTRDIFTFFIDHFDNLKIKENEICNFGLQVIKFKLHEYKLHRNWNTFSDEVIIPFHKAFKSVKKAERKISLFLSVVAELQKVISTEKGLDYDLMYSITGGTLSHAIILAPSTKMGVEVLNQLTNFILWSPDAIQKIQGPRFLYSCRLLGDSCNKLAFLDPKQSQMIFTYLLNQGFDLLNSKEASTAELMHIGIGLGDVFGFAACRHLIPIDTFLPRYKELIFILHRERFISDPHFQKYYDKMVEIHKWFEDNQHFTKYKLEWRQFFLYFSYKANTSWEEIKKCQIPDVKRALIPWIEQCLNQPCTTMLKRISHTLRDLSRHLGPPHIMPLFKPIFETVADRFPLTDATLPFYKTFASRHLFPTASPHQPTKKGIPNKEKFEFLLAGLQMLTNLCRNALQEPNPNHQAALEIVKEFNHLLTATLRYYPPIGPHVPAFFKMMHEFNNVLFKLDIQDLKNICNISVFLSIFRFEYSEKLPTAEHQKIRAAYIFTLLQRNFELDRHFGLDSHQSIVMRDEMLSLTNIFTDQEDLVQGLLALS